MGEWQPIETAPTDGSLILLWGRYWSDDQGEFKTPLIGQWAGNARRWEAVMATWFGVRPTHWMPLPEPPEIT